MDIAILIDRCAKVGSQWVSTEPHLHYLEYLSLSVPLLFYHWCLQNYLIDSFVKHQCFLCCTQHPRRTGKYLCLRDAHVQLRTKLGNQACEQ